MAENKGELEKPVGNDTKNLVEPNIHVMPAEFYGAVPKRRSISASEQAAIEKAMTPEARAAAGVTPSGKQSAPKTEKKKGSLMPVVIVAAVVLLLGGGGATAYFFVFNKKPTEPVKPAGPVCGNSQCESSESYMSCPSDCEAPAPVCGDGTCDSTEDSLTCSADCQTAASVCGDDKCDATESLETCPADCTPVVPVCGDAKCDEETEDHVSCPDDCRPPEPTAGPDLDSDGLTDREEREIFGTAVGNADTDKDSYIDLNETLNLFDPARPVPAMLKDNPGIVTYTNSGFGYSLLRPAAWSVSEQASGRTVFTAQEGEYVEINVEVKQVEQTLMDWYLAGNPTVRSADVSVLKSKSGQEIIQSQDKLTSYVEAGNRVIVMRYDLGKDRMMQYRSTFFMMMQSLKVTEATEPMVEAEEEPAPVPAPEPVAEPVAEPVPVPEPAPDVTPGTDQPPAPPDQPAVEEPPSEPTVPPEEAPAAP